MTRLIYALIGGLLCLATGAVAQSRADDFNISINVENEQDNATLVTLARTVVLLAPRTSGMRKDSRFDFRSGSGLVDGGKATDKLLGLLPGPLSTSISTLSEIGNTCDISRHRFADVDAMVVVHTVNDASPQTAVKCFVAALWIFHDGRNQAVSVDNWRVPYARLLSSLASGRPAFAGFDTGEN